MALDQIKIDVENLILGMYVSRLDRPWIQTPFPIQGYFIKTHEDINALKQYCKYVYIDVERGKGPVNANLMTLNSNSSKSRLQSNRYIGKPLDISKLKRNIGIYKNTTTPRKEVKNAQKLKKLAFTAAAHIEQAILHGTRIDIAESKQVVSAMVNSIIKNPDAYLWITKIEDTDAYLYGSSIRTTLWGVTFGRHLGLTTQALENLAMGIMLCDIGKLFLEKHLLEKNEDYLTDDEWVEYTKHVEYALEELTDYKELDPQVLGIISCINERHDGSGYPRSLQGDQIPLLAKVAGIAKYYDSLTFPRNESVSLTADEAMNWIYKRKNILFQDVIVEEFIQAIGIYPAGTLVELSSGETAIIVEQNQDRRLRPKVMLLLDPDKQPYKKFKTLDMAKDDIDPDGFSLEIERCLPIGAYGADPSMVYEAAFSRWSFPLAS